MLKHSRYLNGNFIHLQASKLVSLTRREKSKLQRSKLLVSLTHCWDVCEMSAKLSCKFASRKQQSSLVRSHFNWMNFSLRSSPFSSTSRAIQLSAAVNSLLSGEENCKVFCSSISFFHFADFDVSEFFSHSTFSYFCFQFSHFFFTFFIGSNSVGGENEWEVKCESKSVKWQ